MITLSVVLRAGTFAGTARIRDAVERAGGTILDARELGGRNIALTLELAAIRVKDLRTELHTLSAALLEDGEEQLERLIALDRARADETETVLMHVAFLNEEPDRKVKVPAVPG